MNSEGTPVYIGKSPFGRGLFAARDIAAGERVLRFTGPLLTLGQVWAKGPRSMNALQIDKDRYLDIGPPGVLVNHSCRPNAGVNRQLELIAMANIAAHAEIFYDYSTVMSEDLETMVCQCGEPECRSLIGDFDQLPDDVQERSVGAGMLPDFILAEIRRGAARRLVARR